MNSSYIKHHRRYANFVGSQVWKQRCQRRMLESWVFCFFFNPDFKINRTQEFVVVLVVDFQVPSSTCQLGCPSCSLAFLDMATLSYTSLGFVKRHSLGMRWVRPHCPSVQP